MIIWEVECLLPLLKQGRLDHAWVQCEDSQPRILDGEVLIELGGREFGRSVGGDFGRGRRLIEGRAGADGDEGGVWPRFGHEGLGEVLDGAYGCLKGFPPVVFVAALDGGWGR